MGGRVLSIPVIDINRAAVASIPHLSLFLLLLFSIKIVETVEPLLIDKGISIVLESASISISQYSV